MAYRRHVDEAVSPDAEDCMNWMIAGPGMREVHHRVRVVNIRPLKGDIDEARK